MKEKIQEYKMFLLIVVIAVIGANAAIFKIGIREIPVDLFTFLRFGFAIIAFLPYLLTQQTKTISNKKKLILISLICAANVILFIVGLEHTTATISGMLYGAVPLITSALAYLIIGEKVSFKKWLGIIVGFLGILVIILSPLFQGLSIASGTLIGNLIIFAAVLAFCFYSVLSKKYSSEYSPMVLAKYFFFTTFIIQSIFLLFHLEKFKLLAAVSVSGWLSVLYIGVLGTTLYYFLYQYVIKKASPVLASTVFFLQPLANILWARFLLGEDINHTFFVGLVLIFVGMGLVFHEQYSKSKINA